MGVEKITLTGASESLNAGFEKVNTIIDYLLEGDGTKRVFRVSKVTIADGTTASTIKVSAASVFNGDTVAEENNLGASGDTGNFTLDSTKSSLHIESGGLTGNCTHVPLAIIERNAGGEFPYCQASCVANGITLKFRKNDDGNYDLTSHVDNGNLYIIILYLTSE